MTNAPEREAELAILKKGWSVLGTGRSSLRPEGVDTLNAELTSVPGSRHPLWVSAALLYAVAAVIRSEYKRTPSGKLTSVQRTCYTIANRVLGSVWRADRCCQAVCLVADRRMDGRLIKGCEPTGETR